MKTIKNNLQKISVLVLFAVLIFTACTKDVDVTEDFSFTLTTDFAASGFVNEEEAMSLTIVPLREVAGTDYFFSFTVVGGDGIFKKTSGTAINSGDSAEIQKQTTLNYLPSTVGTHTISIKVRSSNNFEVEKTITYEVNNEPFSISATAENTPIYLGDTTTFINILITEQTPSSDPYQYKYTYSTGGGNLTTIIGDPITVDSFIDMPTENMITLEFEGTTVESVEIQFTAKNTVTGEEQVDNVTIEVMPNVSCDYEFVSAEFVDNTNPESVGTPRAINFDITQDNTVPCTTDYTMTFSVVNGNSTGLLGVYTDTSGTHLPGSSFTITDLENYNSGQFIATGSPGTYEVTFTITNPDAAIETQTQTTTLEFTYPEITVVMDQSPVGDEVYAKQVATYEFSLSEGNPDNNEYTVTLTATGDNIEPTIMSGGITYVLGTSVENVLGSFNFTIAPQATGTANYTLTVAQDGVSNTFDFSLTSNVPEFEITLALNGDDTVDETTPPIEVNVGEEFDLTVAIALLDNYDQDLIYNYEIRGNFEVEDSSGVFVDAPFDRNDVTSDSGTHVPELQTFVMKALFASNSETIRVTVSNEYGFEVLAQKIYIKVVE